MGGFFLVTIQPDRTGDAEVAALDRAFRELGFAEPVTIRDPAYILCVYPNFQERQAALRRFPQDGFAFACGTLLLDGEVGEAAAAIAYEAGPAIEGRLSQALGHYCLLTRHGGKTELRTDRFGGYHILFH